jgi:hypothetical protein
MSTTNPAPRPATPTAPIGMIVVLCLATLLYLLMNAWIMGLRDGGSDAAGRGLAGVYILFAGFLLWILLGVLLLMGAVGGRMPLAATLAAVLLLPASAVGVAEALEVYEHDIDLVIVVPVLLPLVFAAYALWARFVTLQARLGPVAASTAAGLAIVALTALPFAVKAWEGRPNPERDARLAAEYKARQEAEERRFREEKEQQAAAFAKLGPDSSLMDYLRFTDTSVRDQAYRDMKKVRSRQADIVMLLQKKGLDGSPILLDLDLQPTAELCQAYGTALASAATQISPKVRSDYGVAAMQLEYQADTIAWLTSHDCNLDEALGLAATNIRAVSDSDRFKKFADKLERMRTSK